MPEVLSVSKYVLHFIKIGLPGAGGFGGAAFAFAWTHGIGIAAELYFKKDGDVSAEELEAARKEGAMEGKQQHQAGEGNQKFKLGLTDSESTLRGCVFMLLLGGVLSAPLSHAEYNAFRLGEAAGWYVGVHHVLSAIKYSPCGYVMRKDYDVGSAITEVKRYLRDAEKREFETTLRSQDFKQQLRDLENTFIL